MKLSYIYASILLLHSLNISSSAQHYGMPTDTSQPAAAAHPNPNFSINRPIQNPEADPTALQYSQEIIARRQYLVEMIQGIRTFQHLSPCSPERELKFNNCMQQAQPFIDEISTLQSLLKQYQTTNAVKPEYCMRFYQAAQQYRQLDETTLHTYMFLNQLLIDYENIKFPKISDSTKPSQTS